MAAALWIMVALAEAARRMQRRRQKQRRRLRQRQRRRRQVENQNVCWDKQLVGSRCQLQLSTDISWQLAKDADGPDGKMKNTRKFGFSEYVRRTRI
jgi:hypothetical protein